MIEYEPTNIESTFAGAAFFNQLSRSFPGLLRRPSWLPVRSNHSGFLLLISATFFFLDPALICFSLFIASPMVWNFS
jgi:hypothetical protein